MPPSPRTAVSSHNRCLSMDAVSSGSSELATMRTSPMLAAIVVAADPLCRRGFEPRRRFGAREWNYGSSSFAAESFAAEEEKFSLNQTV